MVVLLIFGVLSGEGNQKCYRKGQTSGWRGGLGVPNGKEASFLLVLIPCKWSIPSHLSNLLSVRPILLSSVGIVVASINKNPSENQGLWWRPQSNCWWNYQKHSVVHAHAPPSSTSVSLTKLPTGAISNNSILQRTPCPNEGGLKWWHANIRTNVVI